MASITSLMNSNYNTSSIYGSRNILSGLASGMDTETMIENAVSGIKTKIQNLLKKRTKIEWQQEAYRSIIDKAVNLSNKYASYSSKTNLLSSSFFNNAVITSTRGTYADKVTASGKTTSNIKINAVKQLATAASYTVSGSAALGGDFSTITGGKEVDLSSDMDVSRISGSLSIQYGGSNGTSFDLSFDELDIYDNAEDLAGAIREKLGEQTWTYTKNGVQETVKGSDLVDVQVDEDGNITFSDKTSDGNTVYISSAYGDIKGTLGVRTGSSRNTIEVGDTALSEKISTREYLSDKELSVSLNGTSKTIKMSDVLDKVGEDDTQNAKFQIALQEELDKAFGADKIKVSRDGNGVMSFKAGEDGSTLTLGGSAVKTLGFENGDSNYINASKKLGDLLGKGVFSASNRMKAVGEVTERANSAGTYYVDSKGNKVEQAEDGEYYQIDNTGKAVYDFEINGAHIKVTEDTTLESLMSSINANVNMGVTVSYSKLTNEFKFTASETGANSRVEFGGLAQAMFGPSGSSSDKFSDAYGLGLEEGGSKTVSFKADGGISQFEVTSDMTMEDIVNKLNKSPFSAYGYTASYDERSGRIVMADENGKTLDLEITSKNEKGETVEYKSQSGSSYTAGQDAIMDMEINGKRFESLSRSSNNFDIDGLNITVKGVFDAESVEEGKDYEPVTFETVTDTDKIVEAIRSFVNDYNEMVTELKSAYSTLPGQQSNGSRYEPLTAEQEAEYTESELAAYNEKAKQGILFGDTTLSSMYGKLLGAIAPGGVDGQTLREIGIGTAYENGLTTISLDEDKLRATLDGNPDKVKDAFTKTVDGGSSSNGLMQTLQNTLNTYVKTTGEPKGVLITKAGSIKAPTSLNNNSLYTQMSNIDKQIQRWQDKMASQIDRFTSQFSKLEQLVAQMNAQASSLAGLMGGTESY